ncbi:spore protease YyaC [Amphibacillus jilinensis]|uniref:spore protease YyaC n=1 Tax=Amphibacillus jilinensis TaxID=1216008 RepID=UPI000310DBE6|nr:spore protease YyaC [Amphibacillus jilinensis]
MKLTDQNQSRSISKKWHYQKHFVYREIADFVYQWLPEDKSDIVIVCIGSDRSTGDALGPITGTHLSKWRLTRFHVYGTLKKPVHALNLTDELSRINKSHPHAFIIAIDACLGRATSIGKITASVGPLKPGLALKKKLPEVGHLHITGIVNASTPVDYLTLQNTRLHLVMELAETIARSFLYLQRNYIDKRKQQIN